MRKHVTKTVSRCFASLRQVNSIRRSLTRPVLISLLNSLVLTRLDYGIACLSLLPQTDLRRLQSVLNASARLVFNSSKFDHVKPLLRELRWLPFPYRVVFRLAKVAFRCLQGDAPTYLSDYIILTSNNLSRRSLRSSSTKCLSVPSSRHKTIGDSGFSVAAPKV
jgi:hypothetical protein